MERGARLLQGWRDCRGGAARWRAWHRASCRCPADEAAAAAVLAAKADAVAQREAALAAAGTECGAALAHRDSFGPPASVPTRDAVQDVRAVRDGLWRRVRAVLDGYPAPATAEALGPRFEEAQAGADHLADRQADDAQRVADYLNAIVRFEAAQQCQARCPAPLAEARIAQLAPIEQWRNAWSAVIKERRSSCSPTMTTWPRSRGRWQCKTWLVVRMPRLSKEPRIAADVA